MKKHKKKIYFFKWLFHMFGLKSYPPSFKDNIIQTLEAKNRTHNTTDGKEVQSIYTPYSSSINLKARDYQAKAVPFKINLPEERIFNHVVEQNSYIFLQAMWNHLTSMDDKQKI